MRIEGWLNATMGLLVVAGSVLSLLTTMSAYRPIGTLDRRGGPFGVVCLSGVREASTYCSADLAPSRLFVCRCARIVEVRPELRGMPLRPAPIELTAVLNYRETVRLEARPPRPTVTL